MHALLITSRAQQELDHNHEWWARHRSPEQAGRWYTGFIEALLLLEVDPERFGRAAESDLFSHEIRQLNYGLGKPTHRALHDSRRQGGCIAGTAFGPGAAFRE